MKINRNNYEVYFLDYIEKNLSPELEAELLVFLSQHPDLEAELSEFEEVSLEPHDEVVFDRASLKKIPFQHIDINNKNQEEYFISYHENQLSDSEIHQLLDYLELKPESKKDFELYGKAFLTTQENIVYPRKQELKKFVLAPYKSILRYAAAAVVFISLSISGYFFFNDSDVNSIESIAKNVEMEPNNEKISEVIIEPVIESALAEENTKINSVKFIEKPVLINEKSTDTETVVAEIVPELLKPNTKVVLEVQPITRVSNAIAFAPKPYDAAKSRRDLVGDIQIPNPKTVLNQDMAWKVIEKGLNGYNRLTENEASILLKDKEDGSRQLAFQSDMMAFTTKIKSGR